VARWQPDRAEPDAELREVRARGWALTDEQLAPGIRSVAAPLRDGSGQVVASINVNTHSAETSVEHLRGVHLPVRRGLVRGSECASSPFGSGLIAGRPFRWVAGDP
jgi:DNA-binding IclR family transcriptional regulator